jgi:predicted AAA+ superfamily ATPase
VHNTALISAQRADVFEEVVAKPDEWGRMVESSIGAHLLNYSHTEGFSLHYWRHRNDEVDFVMEKKGKLIGLEVKSGATQSSTGIIAFKKQIKPDKILLVGNSGISWQDFLMMNPAGLF